MKKILITTLLTVILSLSLIGCGGEEQETETPPPTEEGAAEVETSAEETEASTEEAPAQKEAYISSVPYGLNYGTAPEEYEGSWVLTKAYTAEDGDLEVVPDAATINVEISVDANKLVDETKYIHADAANLKGEITFNHGDIDVESYSWSGNWTDWSHVDIVKEGEAYFNGALKVRVRDDDEGMFFDVITGHTIEDMELFNVIGISADGQLVLGYSDDNIVLEGDDEWEYAYIFDKQ